MAQVHNLFTWEIEPLSPSRIKRGLFNAGGSFLNFLLGTAENKDILDLNRTMSKLYEHSRSQDVEINLHTEILNVTAKNMHKIEVVQKKLSNLVEDLGNQIEDISNLSKVLEISMYNSNAFSSLILALMNLNQKTSTLREGVISMVRGKLSPAIIDNTHLQNLLAIIKEKGHSLLIDADNISLNFYYDIATVDAIFDPHTSSILFLVSIPINYEY